MDLEGLKMEIKLFLELAKELYDRGKLTDLEYHELTSLKIKFLKDMEIENQ